MARMHSGKHGKSGSKKPIGRPKPSWVTLKAKEIEALILKLAKEGNKPSQIGMVLRDSYGVPDCQAVIGKTISAVLQEKGETPELPEDLLALVKKAVLIRKHLEANHLDQPAKRGLRLTESKVFRLTKYYKGTGKVAKTWNYNPKEASYLAE